MEFIKIRAKSAAGLVKPLSRERVFAALDTSREPSFGREILRIDNAYLEISLPTISRSEADGLVREKIFPF